MMKGLEHLLWEEKLGAGAVQHGAEKSLQCEASPSVGEVKMMDLNYSQ